MMKTARVIVAISFIAVLLELAIFSGKSDFDMQSYAVGAQRIIAWFLIVVFYVPIKSLVQEDDYAKDWKAIDDGNVSVGIYRGLELLGVSVAAAMLIAKI